MSPREDTVCTIDYARYIHNQMDWAIALITRAEEIPGYEAGALRAKGFEVLADISRIIGRDLTAK